VGRSLLSRRCEPRHTGAQTADTSWADSASRAASGGDRTHFLKWRKVALARLQRHVRALRGRAAGGQRLFFYGVAAPASMRRTRSSTQAVHQGFGVPSNPRNSPRVLPRCRRVLDRRNRYSRFTSHFRLFCDTILTSFPDFSKLPLVVKLVCAVPSARKLRRSMRRTPVASKV
jgi:hypothetical protein